jgi:hypothetical protein
MEPQATLINFSTLAVALSRSSIFLVNGLISDRRRTDLKQLNVSINQTYLLFSALVPVDHTWVYD